MTDLATVTIPARRGKATHLAQGQHIKVINTYGQQVVDTWAFNAAEMVVLITISHCKKRASKPFSLTAINN